MLSHLENLRLITTSVYGEMKKPIPADYFFGKLPDLMAASTITFVNFNPVMMLYALTENKDINIICYDNVGDKNILLSLKYLNSKFPHRIRVYKGDLHLTMTAQIDGFSDMVIVSGNIDYFIFSCALEKLKNNGTIFLTNANKPGVGLILKNKFGDKYNNTCGKYATIKYTLPEYKICVIVNSNTPALILKTQKMYATRHSYTLLEIEDINILKQDIADSYDYSVYFDSNTYIMNPNRRLEDIIINKKIRPKKVITFKSDDTTSREGIYHLGKPFYACRENSNDIVDFCPIFREGQETLEIYEKRIKMLFPVV